MQRPGEGPVLPSTQEADQLEGSSVEMYLGILVDSKCSKIQQCALVAKKANSTQVALGRVLPRKVILRLYSTVMRQHQGYCVQF